MTKLALKYKQAVMIGEGKGIWNYVHILDLSRLYMYFVKAMMKALIRIIPTGKSSYYFCEISSQTQMSIAEAIGKTGKAQGVLVTDKVRSISLKEVGDEMFDGDIREAETILASK